MLLTGFACGSHVRIPFRQLRPRSRCGGWAEQARPTPPRCEKRRCQKSLRIPNFQPRGALLYAPRTTTSFISGGRPLRREGLRLTLFLILTGEHEMFSPLKTAHLIRLIGVLPCLLYTTVGTVAKDKGDKIKISLKQI